MANGITSLPDNPETRVTSDWSTERGTNRASNIRTNVASVYAAATPSADTLTQFLVGWSRSWRIVALFTNKTKDPPRSLVSGWQVIAL